MSESEDPASVPAEEGRITTWITRMRAGDAAAVEPLWQEYFPRLTGYARHLLGRYRSRMSDEEDAALSAFATFWRRFRDGEFPWVTDRETLWKLLATVTARKVRRNRESESAIRRGGGKIVQASALSLESLAADCSALSSADADLACAELLEHLDDGELQTIAVLRLMGYENTEIASELSLSLRTVERKLRLIRTIWLESLQE